MNRSFPVPSIARGFQFRPRRQPGPWPLGQSSSPFPLYFSKDLSPCLQLRTGSFEAPCPAWHPIYSSWRRLWVNSRATRFVDCCRSRRNLSTSSAPRPCPSFSLTKPRLAPGSGVAPSSAHFPAPFEGPVSPQAKRGPRSSCLSPARAYRSNLCSGHSLSFFPHGQTGGSTIFGLSCKC